MSTFFGGVFVICLVNANAREAKWASFAKKAKTENGQYRSHVTDGSLILLLPNWLVENWSFIILGVIFITIKPILVNWLDPEICMTLFYNMLKTYEIPGRSWSFNMWLNQLSCQKQSKKKTYRYQVALRWSKTKSCKLMIQRICSLR